MTFIDFSQESSRFELSKNEVDANPFNQFEKWFNEALSAQPHEANIMALATATKSGRPSVRMMHLKGFDARGFLFYTNYKSRKGREIDENPWASLVLYWSSLKRQVRIVGSIKKVSPQESDEYFHSRPLASQLSTLASHQSEIISNRQLLDESMAELTVQFQNDVPRPAFWGGYRMLPIEIEFWQWRPNRLHDRLSYHLRKNGNWQLVRLSP